MSKLSRKLVLSVLTLVLSVVALGTTTFAWFALGSQATIDQFQLQATAGEGLEIAITGGTRPEATAAGLESLDWRSTYTADNINNVLFETYKELVVDENGKLPGEPNYEDTFERKLFLEALTSANGYQLTTLSSDLEATPGSAATAGTFLELHLSFRSTGAGNVYWERVVLDSEKKIFKSSLSDGSWKGLDGEDVDNGDDTDHYIHHAARVGIQHDFTSGSEAAFVYEHRGSSTDVVITGGIPADYNYILETGAALNTDHGRNGAHSYYEAKTGRLFTGAIGTAIELVTPRVATVEVNGSGNAKDLGALVPVAEAFSNGNTYSVKVVTLRIWLEGWDQNTFDALYQQVLKVSLGFIKQ